MPNRPYVSVVIPTYRRAHLIARAVHSALDQTYKNLEVIVVVDGYDHDQTTRDALTSIADPRLQIIYAKRRLGNASARNLGVRAARGAWLALLDDDDIWLPTKLDRQLATAERVTDRYPIVSCRLIARSARRDFLWPRYLPRAAQPLAEYLFCRRWPLTGDGLAQTSTLLAPTQLLRQIPFEPDLRRYVDQDWLLRAGRVQGAKLWFTNNREPLVIWHLDDDGGRQRVSHHDDWRWALDWAKARRHLLTDRAYAAFLLTLASASGARHGDRAAFLALLREAFRNGRPGGAELLSHCANYAIPDRLQPRLAGLFAERRQDQNQHQRGTLS